MKGTGAGNPCDRDCAWFSELRRWPEWGWCAHPHPLHTGNPVRPGHECRQFAAETRRPVLRPVAPENPGPQ